MDKKSKKRVAVIGAGVSGLAAALKIKAELGSSVDLTIYEARREPGGRTRSFRDPQTGDILDNGQHLLMSCYTSTLEYLEMVGTRENISIAPSLSIPFADQSGKQFKLEASAKLPAPFHLLSGLLKTDLLTPKEKIAATRLGLGVIQRRLDGVLDQMTCAEYLKYFRQPERLIKKLWEPIILATINAPVEKASARLFTNVLKIAFFTKRKWSSLVIPKVPLAQLLISPAIAALEMSSSRLLLGTPVQTITQSGARLAIAADNGAQNVFDSVIVANYPASIESPIPFPESTASPIINAYFWVDKAILHAPIQGFIGSTLQWAFAHSTSLGAQRIALTVSAGEKLIISSAEEITNLLWGDLLNAIPAASDAQLLKSQIIKEKRATPLFTPHNQVKRPTVNTSVTGLFLASDVVQNGLPATIEGAIRNGFAAGKEAVRFMKSI